MLRDVFLSTSKIVGKLPLISARIFDYVALKQIEQARPKKEKTKRHATPGKHQESGTATERRKFQDNRQKILKKTINEHV